MRAFFLVWQWQSVSSILHHSLRSYLLIKPGCFFLEFHLLLSSPLLLQPTPPPHTLCSPSFPHFWSIFYALLHYSQLPFTVHYAFPSFANTFSPFFPSLSFLSSFIFSNFSTPLSFLCFLLWWHHIPLSISPLNNPSLPTTLSAFMFLSTLLWFSLLISYSKHAASIWFQYCLLSSLFYSIFAQMSANVISSKCNWEPAFLDI